MMELAMEFLFTASISLCLAFLFAKFITISNSTPVGATEESSSKVETTRFNEEEEHQRGFEEEDRLLVRESQTTEDLYEYLVGESEIMHEFVEKSVDILESSVEETSNPVDVLETLVEERHEAVESNLIEEERSIEKEVDDDSNIVENSVKLEKEEEDKDETVSKDEKIELPRYEIQVDPREKDVELDAADDDDDDDWEGIEKSEVEGVFSAASKFLASSENLSKLGSDVQMQLYGLHKVALEGPCQEPPPLAVMVSARAKWNAWQRLGNMSPEVAMEQYVDLLSGGIPGWMGGMSQGDHEQGECTLEAGDSKREVHEIISIHHQPEQSGDTKSL